MFSRFSQFIANRLSLLIHNGKARCSDHRAIGSSGHLRSTPCSVDGSMGLWTDEPILLPTSPQLRHFRCIPCKKTDGLPSIFAKMVPTRHKSPKHNRSLCQPILCFHRHFRIDLHFWHLYGWGGPPAWFSSDLYLRPAVWPKGVSFHIHDGLNRLSLVFS